PKTNSIGSRKNFLTAFPSPLTVSSHNRLYYSAARVDELFFLFSLYWDIKFKTIQYIVGIK
ncbi:MAG: hypothetical protein ABGX43_04790, partial [Nitrospinaceae bacterium]